MKRRKGLAGVGVVTKSHPNSATRVEGRISPELFELRLSLDKQTSVHKKFSPQFFDGKPSTPLGVEQGPRVDFAEVMRKRFERADRARRVPPFYIPECDEENFCVLQQRFLAAERDGLEEKMEQLYKQMIIMFAEHDYKLATPMGTIELPPETDTAQGLVPLPERVGWMLKYSSCFCSLCRGPLKWESTHNTRTNHITWYALPCQHAVRFCEDCRSSAHCWLCGVKATGKRKHVYQNVSRNGNHKSCMISPCDICKVHN